MIAIVDCGTPDVSSLLEAFDAVGASARVVCAPVEVERAARLVLPDAGSFARAAEAIRRNGLIGTILDFASGNRPLLGIGTGLELLFDVIYADGEHTGLGLLRGKVAPLAAGSSLPSAVPDEGLLPVRWDRPIPILSGLDQGTRFHFRQRRQCVPLDDRVAVAHGDGGGRFAAVVAREMVFGVQFEPHRSGPAGRRVLANFAAL